MESPRPKMRKHVFSADVPGSDGTMPREIDLATNAVIYYTSEHPDHLVDNIFDHRDGPNGTWWEAASADSPQTILIAFDQPRSVSRLHYEVVEAGAERSQEIRIEASTDGGNSYRHVLTQGYNFSPRGATFQVEDISLELDQVTHLRLTITPNQQGSGPARVTTLHLFEK